MPIASHLQFPNQYPERALYPIEGEVEVEGVIVKPRTMALIDGQEPVRLHAKSAATVMLLGGAPLDGERFLSWNFVASSKALIEAAKDSWASYPNAQFPEVPGDDEWIPLPG
jgi:redox-sensitive bicupin YhaK (pirin superfamily)